MGNYLLLGSIVIFGSGIIMMLLRQPLYKKRGKFLFLVGIIMLLLSMYYDWDRIKSGLNNGFNNHPTAADTTRAPAY